MSFREPPLALAFRRGYGSLEKALPAREMLFALCEAGADLTKVELGAAEEIEAMRSGESYISLYW